MSILTWLKKYSTIPILCCLLLAGAGFVWWFNDTLLEDIFTISCVTLTMVMGFQMFMGNSGILSWSYVGFVGIGAFTSAICSMSPQVKRMQIPVMYDVLAQISMPFWLALLVGALVAALIAAIVAWPLMRLSDAVGIITQFALLIVIYVILLQWQQVTNGPRTFTLGGVKSTTLWIAALVATAAIVVAYLFKESSLGLRLRASRDDRFAASASGINVVAVRYFSYIASAAVGGLAGGLWSHYMLSITAKSFYLIEVFTILTMLVIGGTMSVSGAFFGWLGVTVARQGLRQGELALTQQGFDAYGITEIVLGILMILFLVWRPTGVSKGRELTFDTIADLATRITSRSTRSNDKKGKPWSRSKQPKPSTPSPPTSPQPPVSSKASSST
ncbi:MAG: branched-chain amino acid ABC transporter permease [Bifidobacteriaceae bacterium]|jgi:branched-chain amino acid transport system permease protein|nr:branched-chain amino acid ABC transporter permease [Bifidobacteriaceae bacterium]